jgi:hypothetical protein
VLSSYVVNPLPLHFADAWQHTHRTIIHCGYQYKTLCDHDPYSKQYACGSSKALPSAWHVCPKTPDTLRVCAAYPWQVFPLVFDDGSAIGTAIWAAAMDGPGRIGTTLKQCTQVRRFVDLERFGVVTKADSS